MVNHLDLCTFYNFYVFDVVDGWVMTGCDGKIIIRFNAHSPSLKSESIELNSEEELSKKLLHTLQDDGKHYEKLLHS